MIRILAAVPCYSGKVCVPFVDSYVMTWGLLANMGVQMEMKIASHFSLVQYARNYLIAQFLKDETFTHMLWIDDDLGWDPRAVPRMLARRKDIIAGVYPVKQHNPFFPYQPESNATEDGLQLADKIPLGLCLVARHVIQDVAASVRTYEMNYNGEKIECPNVFDLIHEGKENWGEDFAFCKRARKLGYQIWVETDIDFQHVGTNAWSANLAQVLAKMPTEGPATNRELALPRNPAEKITGSAA